MDYSKLSDFEINKRVAVCLGAKPYMAKDFEKELSGESVIIKSNFKLGAFDPCNNPADAWPIIVGNRISLDSIYERGEKWLSFAGEDGEFRSTDANPLRAAMIVYLMMQEIENE